MTLRPSAALTTATAAGPLTAHASSSGPPAFTLDVSVQSSRFHEAVATTIYVKGINIAVGGGADASKRELLTDADLSLATGTRYALIGRNGSGKSILLRVLASGALFDPDDQLSLRVQLVSQSWAPPPHPGWTVLDEVGAPPFGHDLSDALDAGRRADRRSDLRSGRRGKEARVESLALAAAGEGDGDSGDCGGDDYGDYHDPPSTTDVAAAFMTLGIPIGMLEQRWETLSGGWRMRVVLAKALIYQPRVLLLDEPTNHLDLLGITHLVRLLKDDTHFPDTTIVFVSHDLFFVNELAQSVIQLQDLKLVTAKGNWDTLQRERSDRKTWTDRMAAEQEREQARLMGSLATSMRRAAERGDDKGQRQLASRRDKALERGSGLMRNSHGHRFKRNDAENAGYHLTLLNEVETVREERPVRFRLEEPAWPRAVAGPGSPLLALDGLAFRYTGGGTPAGAAFSRERTDLSLAAGARRVGAAGGLGAATIERAPRRMWVAMMTVLTAVVTTVAVTGATANAVDSTVASFASIADADIWVSSAAATDYSSTLLPPDTQPNVAAVPGVKSVVPGQMAFATVGDTRVMLLGIAPGSHRDIYTSLTPQDREKLLSGAGVALSRDLGKAMNVAVGDELTLQTPTGKRPVRVLALVPYFSGMTGTIAMSLDAMQGWFLRPGATDLELTVTPGADAHAVEAAVQKVVGAGTFVYSGREALAGVASALDQVIAVITIIGWIVVVVSAVTLLNTLMLSVLDRRREIGVLRAIGADRSFTLKAILAEAAGIGLVGGLLGLVLGTVIQYLTCLALTNVLSIDVVWQPSPGMIGIALGALAICLLGSLPPAVRAARINIVEAIGVD